MNSFVLVVLGKIINDGLLSRLQLEGVLYAGQRHQKILSNGKRAGFFIADGAGERCYVIR